MFFSAELWISLATLTVLEIVLGIDNIVFISILAGKLRSEEQAKARFVGLSLALILRLLLLFCIAWVMRLTSPLLVIFDHAFSGRDLILLFGGLFLIAKATHEIYDKLEAEQEDPEKAFVTSFVSVVTQIGLLDIVFSLDSVITAVGMTDKISVMIAAMVIAVLVMMIFAGRVSRFVNKHPSLKILGLSFLLLIGVLLVGEAFDQHIKKGYVYFAMFFSLVVELLNMRMRKINAPVQLHHRFEKDPTVPTQFDEVIQTK